MPAVKAKSPVAKRILKKGKDAMKSKARASSVNSLPSESKSQPAKPPPADADPVQAPGAIVPVPEGKGDGKETQVKFEGKLVRPLLKSPPGGKGKAKVSAPPADIPYSVAEAKGRRALPGHVDKRTVTPRGTNDHSKKIPSGVCAAIMSGDKNAEHKWFETFRTGGCVFENARLEEETRES